MTNANLVLHHPLPNKSTPLHAPTLLTVPKHAKKSQGSVKPLKEPVAQKSKAKNNKKKPQPKDEKPLPKKKQQPKQPQPQRRSMPVKRNDNRKVDVLSVSPSESEDSDHVDKSKMVPKKKKQPMPAPSSYPPSNTKPIYNKQPTSRRQPPVMMQDFQKKSFAGASFNNTPAPSALPLPPPPVGQSIVSHDDVFHMEMPPTMPPLHHPFIHPPPDLQAQSRHLMHLLAPRHYPQPVAKDHTLSQIQQDLRSMLKLEAA
ncbi:hypothetical protein DM01DRAFT_1409001 [Hesseltinella vesiculosa]|uniref:Uncharacterized protein n=1 Tax=Hesseltinella vesiculosa TaxID=101127 RepID=A0A1X2GC62_9FUNG|nr:hypothetical protein DM01DRAFT_1409001 [Hesseltinella vesiculosa]